jgi:predicted DNA-binding ribbon-helix-helix protein
MTKARNKRSLTIARHRTSVSLEEPFWTALAEIAEAQGKSIAALVSEIDKGRSDSEGSGTGLSAAIRLYVLERSREPNAR